MKNELRARIQTNYIGLAYSIILFAIPVGLSNIVQQLFNAADTAVLGHFSDSGAMAAVGATAPIINLYVSLFVGMSIGGNVLIARLRGRSTNIDPLAIDTLISSSVMFGIILLILSISFSNILLSITNIPIEIKDSALLYLRTYSLGFPFITFFNYCAALLRGFGDTNLSMYALTLSGFINIILNVVFVGFFKLSVFGVAIATVISSLFCAFFIWINAYRIINQYQSYHFHFKINLEYIIYVTRIGMPAGLQGILFSISNSVIQIALNSLGMYAVAGASVAFVFECIGYHIINAFNQASVTYIGMYYSSKKYDICKKVFRLCLLFGLVSCFLINTMTYISRRQLLLLLTTDINVIYFAQIRMKLVLLFQCIAASYEISASSLRGMGYSLTPALLTVFGTCLIRVIWVRYMFLRFSNFETLMVVYPISWIITGVLMIMAYWAISKKCMKQGDKL